MKQSFIIDHELAAKVLSGEATTEEQQRFDAWLISNDQNQTVWEEIIDTWKLTGHVMDLNRIDSNKAWQKVKGNLSQKSERKLLFTNAFRYAAAFAAAILVFGALVYYFTPQTVRQTDFMTLIQYTDTATITLSDGTRVALNQGSSIEYSEMFNENERRIHLKGEGWFDVAFDQERTFIVETNNLEVRVLGTSFNVRSYDGKALSQVDVNRGIVEVISFDSELEPVKLVAGDGIDYFVQSRNIVKRPLLPNNLAWKTGEIRFSNSPLSHVFNTLENLYHVQVRVDDSTILQEKLGASFSHNTFDYIMEVICLTFDLEVNASGEFISVYRAGSRPN